MKPAILLSQAASLNAIAAAWLAAGARAVCIWSGGQSLQSWPPDWDGTAHDLAAPVTLGETVSGELRVSGCRPDLQARLNADAAAITQIARLENDLQFMTAECIDNQDQLLALYELTRSTHIYLGVDGILHLLAREASRLVKSAGAFVILAQGANDYIASQYPQPVISRQETIALLDLARRTEHELMANASTPALPLPPGVKNLLLVPIEAQRGLNAALGLYNKTGGFTAPDQKLAQTIAYQAASQIDNALLQAEAVSQAKLKTEIDLAARIQLQLLPRRMPRWKRLQISARSRPALQVGGDFYEFIAQPGRHLTFAIGDVAGKGIAAALLMTMTHTVIRSATKFMPEAKPERVMQRLNENLYDDFTEVSLFATVFVAQYDSTTHELVYANAGHSPVIYKPRLGPARLLEADSPPIGVLPESLAREHRVPFGPDDLLIAATDGFTDAANAQDERFGYDAFIHLVERYAREPVETILNVLYNAVDAHAAGTPQADDLTAVIIKGSVE